MSVTKTLTSSQQGGPDGFMFALASGRLIRRGMRPERLRVDADDPRVQVTVDQVPAPAKNRVQTSPTAPARSGPLIGAGIALPLC